MVLSTWDRRRPAGGGRLQCIFRFRVKSDKRGARNLSNIEGALLLVSESPGRVDVSDGPTESVSSSKDDPDIVSLAV